MQYRKPFLLISSVCSLALGTNTGTLGYNCQPHCIQPSIPTTNNSFSFGQHYAVLNLDLMNILVGIVANSTAGNAFIKNTANWIDAVHKQSPPPLSIFTRTYWSNSRTPQLRPGIPYAEVGKIVGGPDDPNTFIHPAFKVDVDAGDVVLQKTRYYAGSGNSLEQILSTQQIDTVILSGLSTAGVIMSSVYQLVDLNYNVYVIANNTIQPGTNAQLVNTAFLEDVIPALPAHVITIEQAMAALERSGPAIY